jgi:hypothetical protein
MIVDRLRSVYKIASRWLQQPYDTDMRPCRQQLSVSCDSPSLLLLALPRFTHAQPAERLAERHGHGGAHLTPA